MDNKEEILAKIEILENAGVSLSESQKAEMIGGMHEDLPAPLTKQEERIEDRLAKMSHKEQGEFLIDNGFYKDPKHKDFSERQDLGGGGFKPTETIIFDSPHQMNISKENMEAIDKIIESNSL